MGFNFVVERMHGTIRQRNWIKKIIVAMRKVTFLFLIPVYIWRSHAWRWQNSSLSFTAKSLSIATLSKYMAVQSAFERMLHLLPFPLILVLPALCVLFMLVRFQSSKRPKPLPPGPKAWPVIGNIPHIGNLPHISMTNFSKVYGPLISLKLGTQVVVVASSKAAATEILKTHDRLLSTRYVPNASRMANIDLDRMGLLFAPRCTDGWKTLRTLCKTELFSAKAIETQAILREQKVREMVGYLKSKEGKVVNIGESVFTTVFNTLGNMLFSKDLIGLEDNGLAGGLKGLISKMVELSGTPNIVDFYPILAALDPQGLRREVTKCYTEMCAVWEILTKERRESFVSGAPKKDFLDVFLANGFDNHRINWLTMELLVAGTDTTTATVEWAMTELLKNKQVMKKVCEEIEREINGKALDESLLPQLPYLNACIKETLRLHPPAPFLVPRRALETCEIMGYTVPKDAQVLVNVWAIARDPSVWEDPLSFKPDRFIGSNVDYKGHHHELLPFGAGRRTCPGLPLATKEVSLILASLLHHFNWSLPNDGDPSKLDVNEKFGIVLQKEKPLLFVPHSKP